MRRSSGSPRLRARTAGSARTEHTTHTARSRGERIEDASPGGGDLSHVPRHEFPRARTQDAEDTLLAPRILERSDEAITVVPDWVCEVLSPSTRSHDQRIKRPLYAQAGVRWMWRVEPELRTATASRNEGGKWLELGVFVDDDVLRAEPFEVHAIELRDLWLTR